MTAFVTSHSHRANGAFVQPQYWPLTWQLAIMSMDGNRRKNERPAIAAGTLTRVR